MSWRDDFLHLEDVSINMRHVLAVEYLDNKKIAYMMELERGYSCVINEGHTMEDAKREIWGSE